MSKKAKMTDINQPLLSAIVHSVELEQVSNLALVNRSYYRQLPKDYKLYRYVKAWSSDSLYNPRMYDKDVCDCRQCQNNHIHKDGVTYLLKDDSRQMIFEDNDIEAFKFLVKYKPDMKYMLCDYLDIQTPDMWFEVTKVSSIKCLHSIWHHALTSHNADEAFRMIDKFQEAGLDMQEFAITVVKNLDDDDDYDNISCRIGDLCILDTCMVNYLSKWQTLIHLNSYFDQVQFANHLNIYPLHELAAQYTLQNHSVVLPAIQRLFPDDAHFRNFENEDDQTILEIVFERKRNLRLRQFLNQYKHDGRHFEIN
jgi:hypothetical protein